MKNVWIVDDDRSIRWVLEKALQKADIPCKTFSEAESVLQAIKKEHAELIEEVLNAPEDEKVIARVREKVNATMKDYPLFAY